MHISVFATQCSVLQQQQSSIQILTANRVRIAVQLLVRDTTRTRPRAR